MEQLNSSRDPRGQRSEDGSRLASFWTALFKMGALLKSSMEPPRRFRGFPETCCFWPRLTCSVWDPAPILLDFHRVAKGFPSRIPVRALRLGASDGRSRQVLKIDVDPF